MAQLYAAIAPAVIDITKTCIALVRFALLAIILLPTTIIVGVKSNFDGLTAKTVNFLGDISFPVYAVHTPLLWGMGFLVKKWGLLIPIKSSGLALLLFQ